MGLRFNPLTGELELSSPTPTLEEVTAASSLNGYLIYDDDGNLILASNTSGGVYEPSMGGVRGVGLYANIGVDGSGIYDPSVILGTNGLLSLETYDPSHAPNRIIELHAADGIQLVTTENYNDPRAFLSTSSLSANRTFQFPDIDGTFVTSDATGMVGINTLVPSEKLTVNGNYLLRDADTATKAYRFRTSGSDLDLDGAGANLYVSMYQNADFTGTQRFYLGFNASSHYADAFGNWIFHNDIFGAAYFSIRDDNGEVVVNDDASNLDFRVENQSLSHMIYVAGASAAKNIALLAGSVPNWQSMDGGLFIGNGTTIPAGNPTSGGFLYVDTGALKYRGSGGTVTTIAAA